MAVGRCPLPAICKTTQNRRHRTLRKFMTNQLFRLYYAPLQALAAHLYPILPANLNTLADVDE